MIFYIFSALAIMASLMMIFSHNPVRAVLFLVMAFVSMAGVWLLLEAEFLAIALILVYVGAVMVLFLFVVMMLDIEAPQLKQSLIRQIPLGLLISGLMVLMLMLGLGKMSALDYAEPMKAASDYSNIKALGTLLYTEYVLPFEIAGVILLVAMIAAIGLAFRGGRSKRQDISQQVQVTKADRLKMIKTMGVS